MLSTGLITPECLAFESSDEQNEQIDVEKMSALLRDDPLLRRVSWKIVWLNHFSASIADIFNEQRIEEVCLMFCIDCSQIILVASSHFAPYDGAGKTSRCVGRFH